jgi:hypothetical protein
LAQSKISYIDVRFAVHATEDVDKVTEAVQNIMPFDYLDDIIFESRIVEGHYGNPITFFETRIKKDKITTAIIQNIFSKLSALDKENVARDLDRYVDEGSLYIRLDKQAAFLKKIKLTVSDPIRFRVRFRKFKNEDMIEICRTVGIIA